MAHGRGRCRVRRGRVRMSAFGNGRDLVLGEGVKRLRDSQELDLGDASSATRLSIRRMVVLVGMAEVCRPTHPSWSCTTGVLLYISLRRKRAMLSLVRFFFASPVFSPRGDKLPVSARTLMSSLTAPPLCERRSYQPTLDCQRQTKEQGRTSHLERVMKLPSSSFPLRRWPWEAPTVEKRRGESNAAIVSRRFLFSLADSSCFC